MKKNTLLLLAFSFLGLISRADISDHYIEVRGQAEQEVVPNEIFIDIILSEEEIGSGKLGSVEKKMSSAFKKIGINVQKDLKVKHMSNKLGRAFLRKDVDMSKSYELKVTKANQVSQVLEILQDLEVSRAWISKQTHTDIKKLEKETKVKAVLDAKEKAQTYLAPLNQKVGKAIYIIDQGSYNVVAMSEIVRPAKFLKRRSMAEDIPPPSLEFKKIKVKSNILIRFKLD